MNCLGFSIIVFVAAAAAVVAKLIDFFLPI